MNYNIILNEIKELVLRDEIKSNDEVVSLYDLVEVLNEYIKPINEVLGNKELLDKIKIIASDLSIPYTISSAYS